MDSILIALLQWISANSSYDAENIPLPMLVAMTNRQLTEEYYAEVPELMPRSGIDSRVNALYDATKQKIYVLDARLMENSDEFEFPEDNPIWRETVLHELIHHVQWQSGQVNQWECRRFGEKEAYTLGGIYLKQNYAVDPMPNRRFWAHFYSRC